MTKFFLSSVCLVGWVASISHGQIYFPGPFGADGSLNLYELRGTVESYPRLRLAHGEPGTLPEAVQALASSIETFTGLNVPGHLVAIGFSQENDFVAGLIREETWIGLSDNESFAGAAEANDDPNGPWVWINGEASAFRNFREGRPNGWGDSVVIEPPGSPFAGFWEDDRSGLPGEVGRNNRKSYIVEYPTEITGPLPAVVGTIPKLPGVEPRFGAFGVREVSSNGPVENLSGAVASLANIRPEATVVEYSVPTLNFNEEAGDDSGGRELFGENRPFETQRLSEASDNLSHLALVAHGKIVVPPESAGVWQFKVGSDDAFELVIHGGFFELPDEELRREDEPQITPYGSFQHFQDRSFRLSTAQVYLAPGTHALELVYNEASGNAALELSAKGPHDAEFQLVGSPLGLQLVPEPDSLILLLVLLSTTCLFAGKCSRLHMASSVSDARSRNPRQANCSRR